MSFISLLRRHRSFIIPFFIFLVFAFAIEGFYSKAECFLLTNAYHSPFWDKFFLAITWLGDGKVVLLVGVALCLLKFRHSLLLLACFVYSSLVVQLLKYYFHAPRPVKFFEGLQPIRTVPGCDTHDWYSFPSGHSASAFTFAVVLMHMLPYKFRAWIIFPLSVLVIFSRIYLAQHFLQDVIAGSILGTVLSLQMIWWLENTKWYHSAKLDGKLFR